MMESHPQLKIVASNKSPPHKAQAEPSKVKAVLKLSLLLIVSLIIWGGVIWYCVMMWKAS